MKILIDADGCPVVDETLAVCRPRNIPVVILCDTAHRIERAGAQTLVFDQGADSVDFALVNRLAKGDVAVTQDYGLAALCLARGGRALNQNGLLYTNENIDGLLETRYQAKKLVRAGKHPNGPARRTRAQDEAFTAALTALLDAGKAPPACV